MERTLRNVPVRDLQLDECWSYVLKKEGHKLPHETKNASGINTCSLAWNVAASW